MWEWHYTLVAIIRYIILDVCVCVFVFAHATKFSPPNI